MSIGDRISTGVGGAGNIGSPKLRPTDPSAQNYSTPALKGTHYPTGRGGAGNMASNTDAATARKAQDVSPQVITSTSGTGVAKLSSGRGGMGNMVRDGSREERERGRPQKSERSGSGVFVRAQEALGRLSGSRRRGSEAGSVRSNVSAGSR